MEVEDDGKPFNPLDAAGPEVSQDLDSINIGGLGIHPEFVFAQVYSPSK